MSNSLPRAAATAKDGYPRDNFHGESSDQSYAYPNPQKQQISQLQGYPPKADFPQPSVQVLHPKHDYMAVPSSDQTSDQDHPKQRKPLNQFQQQQLLLPPVLPQNPPKSNNFLPSSQIWDQSRQQEPGYSTQDNHDPSFNHLQQPSSPRDPIKQNPGKNDSHPPSSSTKTSHQSQPRQPSNGVASKDQHPTKNSSNQYQQQMPSAPPPAPSTETGLLPSGIRDKTRTVQSEAKLPSNQPVNEPVVAYPDLSSLPPKTTIKITIPPKEQPRSDQKGGCCCSIL
ncbi:hypothetical protein PTKIN_Ptkin16aG0483500 [Pterospermum kingtungense]